MAQQRGAGLAQVYECRIEGAPAAGDTTVLPEELWCFRAQPSGLPSCSQNRAPPSPPSRSEDFAVVTHTDTQTHTGHTPAPFRGSSHRQALGSVCDNGPHAAAGTSVPLPVSRDTRYIPEVTGLLRQAASRQKDQKKPLQVFS